MDILILADFCGALDISGNNRFLYLAGLLAKEHQVEVVTSDFRHGTKTYFSSAPADLPFRLTLLHEGAYTRNVSLRRFWAHWIWARSVRRYLRERKRPDVIYAAVPPLAAAREAARYCEKTGVRFVVDIQDLWPEAFQMVFSVPVLGDLAFIPFRLMADGIYRQADAVCAVSETYVNRALRVNRKCAAAATVFLGTKLAVFDENVRQNSADPLLPPQDGRLYLAYCGALGASYDLGVVLDAMRLLADERLVFVVMGDGERKQEFQEKAGDLPVLFTGSLPYPRMCAVLNACDIAVNPIRPGTAATIINKHADYAAAGLPVLNTQENREYRKLVEAYRMGFNCRGGDARDLADKLKRLLDDESLRLEMGKNARRCAEERFDRAKSYSALTACLTKESGKS